MGSGICFRKPAVTTKAMKLGSKSRDVESFVDQLKSEGENVVAPVVTRATPTPRVPIAAENTEEYVEIFTLDVKLKYICNYSINIRVLYYLLLRLVLQNMAASSSVHVTKILH